MQSDLKKRGFRFCLVWVAVVVWQSSLAVVMLRSFAADLFPIGFLSYAFSTGYLIGIITDCSSWGPMPLSDWRWCAGVVVMLCVSGLAVFPISGKCRQAAGLLFATLHFAGSFCTAVNMASAIT